MNEDRPSPSPPDTDLKSADHYIAEIARRDAEQAQPDVAVARQRPISNTLLMVLIPVLVILSAWNVVRAVRAEVPEVFTPAQEEADARFTIYLAVQEIETFRDTSGAGALPANLELLILDGDYLEYSQNGSDYTLTFQLNEIQVTYRSGDDLTPFAEGYLAFEEAGQP